MSWAMVGALHGAAQKAARVDAEWVAKWNSLVDGYNGLAREVERLNAALAEKQAALDEWVAFGRKEHAASGKRNQIITYLSQAFADHSAEITAALKAHNPDSPILKATKCVDAIESDDALFWAVMSRFIAVAERDGTSREEAIALIEMFDRIIR